MKISYQLLQTYFEQPLPAPEVLAEKFTFHLCEVESVESHPSGDTIFDLSILPDRASDCLSHQGIAQEISILFSLPLKSVTYNQHDSIPASLEVIVETDACKRYSARKILNVSVGESPEWLKNALEKMGQKSINNIVDAGNYVMYMTGQPIHVFDDSLVQSLPPFSGHGIEPGESSLIIRNAKNEEKLETLSGDTIALDDSMIVIADAHTVLALGGIKGGKRAEVNNTTKHIIIEVANFDAATIRKTARKINLLTDSAKRFENNIHPHQTEHALHMMTDLVIDLAGGQPEFILDYYPNPTHQHTVSFSREYIAQRLGYNIHHSHIADIFARANYHYTYDDASKEYCVTIPWNRKDLTGPHDMVEEIGRIFGYHHIQPEPFVTAQKIEHDDIFKKMHTVKNHLWKQGYQEIMTYTFVKKGDQEIVRGPKDKSALRKNLTNGFSEALAKSQSQIDIIGKSEIKLFEVGTVFSKTEESVHVVYNEKNSIHEMTLDEYIAKYHLDSTIIQSDTMIFDYSLQPFTMWSQFPYIVRDVAVWVSEHTTQEVVRKLIQDYAGDLLIGQPRLFDMFIKDERVSYAFRLVFQSYEKTLTDSEVNQHMEAVYRALQEKGWEIR